MTELRNDWLIGYYALGRDKSGTKTTPFAAHLEKIRNHLH